MKKYTLTLCFTEEANPDYIIGYWLGGWREFLDLEKCSFKEEEVDE